MRSVQQKTSTLQVKREKYFEIYSKNLVFIKEHPNIHISPDIEGSIICPLCFKLFSKEGLSNEYADRLTLEDIPPKKLGGHPLILTCKVCNNNAGSKLEAHLIRKLDMDEFLVGTPGINFNTNLRLSQGFQIPATTVFNTDGSVQMNCFPKSGNPTQIQSLIELIKQGEIKNFSLNYLPGNKIGRAEIALIRIAYLMAFAKFGYGFLINPCLQLVRKQIQIPEKKILPDWGIINDKFPDEFIGINILYKPSELCGYFIVFDLKTKYRCARYGVLLPRPSSPGVDIYDSLAEFNNRPAGCSLEYSIRKVPDLDYLGKPELAFASHKLWETLSVE